MKCHNYRKTIKLIYSLGLLFVSIVITSCIDMASNDLKNKQVDYKNTTYANGEVYTMRGGLGGIFSKGMNRLQDKLVDSYHVHSYSTVWYKESALSDYIIKRYTSKELKGPIILVGHSLGANDQIKVARNLARANIHVALLMTVDATSPLTVPPNVAQVVNIYYPANIPLFSGQQVRAMNPKYTHVENFDVTKGENINVNHFNIESNPSIQKMMLEKILTILKKEKKEQGL